MEKKDSFKLLLIPSILGLIFSIVNMRRCRNEKSILFFCFFLALFLLYWYPTYDSMGRYAASGYIVSWNEFFDGDPLINLMSMFNPYIDAFYFLFVFFLLGLWTFSKTILNNYGSFEKLPSIIILFCTMGMTFPYLCNLTFFTLSITVSFYLISKYTSRYLFYIPIFALVYIIHPGALIVVPAALVLHFLIKKSVLLGFSFLIGYGIIFFLILHSGAFFTHFLELVNNDLITSSYNSYTSDENQWGLSDKNFGMKGMLWNFLLYTFYAIIAFVSIKNIKEVKNNVFFSIFMISVVAVIDSKGFYTFFERTTISAYLSSLVLLSYLFKNGCLSNLIIKYSRIMCMIIFFLSFFIYPQPREHLFGDEKDSYYVSARTFIYPSVMLFLDIHDLGFSDDYLSHNSSTMFNYKQIRIHK